MTPAADPGLGLKVVAIGGGTGLATLLRGLKSFVPLRSDRPTGKPYISNLTAVVTVTDDGGSSGRLRKDLGVLPPGDIRNCMIALSEDEQLLARLFQYRFTSGELEGHNFGNLFLTALSSITGDFAEAVKLSSGILKARGEIVPSTTSNVQLDAILDDGSRVRGETSISASRRRIVRIKLVPANARPLPQTLRALAEADLITIGPGSLFTSLVPNLLVNGIPEAIAASKGLKAYVGNLMTQANESLGLSASQHLEIILRHCATNGSRICDYALINTAPISPTLLERYARGGQAPIEPALNRLLALGVEPISGDFALEGNLLRHDPDRVTQALLALALNRP